MSRDYIFAPSHHDIRLSLLDHRAYFTTKRPLDHRKLVTMAWKQARSGDPGPLRKYFQAKGQDRYIEWPWLDSSASYLDRLSLVPEVCRWSKSASLSTLPEDERGKLLVGTIIGGSYDQRQRAEIMALEYCPEGWRLYLVPGPNCPAAAHFSEMFRSMIAAGDLSRTPPFFPGDQSYLAFGRPPPGY